MRAGRHPVGVGIFVTYRHQGRETSGAVLYCKFKPTPTISNPRQPRAPPEHQDLPSRLLSLANLGMA